MDTDRYHRQRILPQIGDAGQQILARSRVLLIGCGALGTVIAEQLARGGIGFLRIVDRDIVELSNLQRQVLFDETDAKNSTPKAVAAANRLRAINSSIEIDAHVTDVDSENIESMINGIDLILDGTDNVATRYLINDAAVKHRVRWIYGACVGVEGRVMPIVPGKSACLRCVFPDPPAPNELLSCDTAGVLGAASSIVASLQVVAAIKLLLGDESSSLITFDAMRPRLRLIEVSRRGDCRACGLQQFDFLNAPPRDSAQLCGRGAVQIRPANRGEISLDALAKKLSSVMQIHRTPHLLRCHDGQSSLTIFPDGRAIIHGTNDPARAQSIYARYVGA